MSVNRSTCLCSCSDLCCLDGLRRLWRTGRSHYCLELRANRSRSFSCLSTPGTCGFMAAVVPGVVPVNVDFPAAPVTSDSSILLEANEPLVVATPFIDWQPAPPAAAGGPPRVALAHFLAVKHFLPRCCSSRLPADFAAAAAANPLVLRLRGAWFDAR